MENKAMYSGHQNDTEANVERDLCDTLLQANGDGRSRHLDELMLENEISEDMISFEENPNAKIAYPWDVTAPDSEQFFAQLERDSLFIGWESNEINTRSNAFFSRLDTLWATTSLQVTLTQQFGVRMPQPLLNAIAHRAQQVVATSRSLSDQLVQCAQAALNNLSDLAEDDLHVLARPLAFSMRSVNSQSTTESTLQSVRMAAWEELSELEQARLSLAIASYALSSLETQEEA